MIKNYLLQHQLTNTVSSYPKKAALIINEEIFNYENIYLDCLQLAQYMQSVSSARGTRVLILSGNTYLTVIAYWASLMIDLVPCVIDPECKPDTLKNIIQNITPEICIYHNLSPEQYAVICQFPVSHITHLPKKVHLKDSFSCEKTQNTESDLAMIMHTSGSTGEPKGVMLSHRNVISAIQSINAYLGLHSRDVILSVLPMHFDYGLYQILLGFSVGATVIVENSMLFPQLIAQKIVNHQVTVFPCVPVMVQLFYLSSQRYRFDFSALRMVTNTGENLSPAHIKKLQLLFPNARIFSMYGLTECKRCSYVPPDQLNNKMESIGIPMPNLEMWVQDANGHRLGPNVEGELVIAGPSVMMGYWNNVAATAQKIMVDSFGKRMLKSGDRVVMDKDGYFYFKGRGDSVVKYKGGKLHCVEMIKKLNNMQNVNRSHLFLMTIELERLLIVCIELDTKTSSHDDLIRIVNTQFGSLQQPDHIYITDHFPALSNGKLDVYSLEKRASECFSVGDRV